MKNTSKVETSLIGHKSGQEVAKNNTTTGATTRGRSKLLKDKIKMNTETYFGRDDKVPYYVVRIKNGRNRKYFRLKSDLKESEEMAQQIFDRLRLDGWNKTVEIYRPGDGKKVTNLSVGEYLALLAQHTEVNSFTLETYARALRNVVGGIKGLTYSGYDKYTGCAAPSKWREAVDQVPLETITPSEIMRWRSQYIRDGIAAGRKRASVEHTANSIVRNAKSLFSKRTLKQLKLALPSLVLPTPLPFDDVILLTEHRSDFRYNSTIHAPDLIDKAFLELKEESLVIFCLAIGGGLRRKEIDNVDWSHVNLADGKIIVTHPRTGRLKTDSSVGTVSLEARFIEALKAHAKKGATGFVLFPNRPPRPTVTRIYYRCNAEFDEVLAWLRQNGVTNTDKPIQTLRKEFGSNIAKIKGIHAASASLRHSTVDLTDKYYAERKSHATSFFPETPSTSAASKFDMKLLLELMKAEGLVMKMPS